MPQLPPPTPVWSKGGHRLYHGDCEQVLARLPEASVQCVVTSPPYYGLRDYGTGTWLGGDPTCSHKKASRHQKQGATSQRKGRANLEDQRNETFQRMCETCGAVRLDKQVGMEESVEEYVSKLVRVFRGVWRVLRADGVAWLNLGDSYASGGRTWRAANRNGMRSAVHSQAMPTRPQDGPGVKSKDLLGVPWRVALALQEDGWTLRQDVIWHKPSPMPESVTDRCTRAHEYVFMLSKGPRYYYDVEAVKEPAVQSERRRSDRVGGNKYVEGVKHSDGAVFNGASTRNRRTVWSTEEEETTVLCWLKANRPDVYEEYLEAAQTHGPSSVWRLANGGYKGAHFATFPAKLITPMIMAGTSEKGACPECGTPWHRITEKARTPTRPGVFSKVHGTDAATHGNRDPLRHVSVSRTVGWRAGCSCGTSDTVPCVVLDPFVGSGTTVAVAAELGRRGWGVDLSEEYLMDHAIKRVASAMAEMKRGCPRGGG